MNQLKIYLLFIIGLISISCSSTDEVELRKFPYPFKAALTIASDVDDNDSVEELLHIHNKINSKKDGLGLDIGDSFWMYNELIELMKDSTYDIHTFHERFSGPIPFLGVSIFDGLKRKKSPNADVIESLIRKGYIDALHSYGQFAANTFDRGYAADALKYLKDNNLNFDVFIGHGGHENTNNVGPWPWQLGDNPDTKEYHTDLTVPFGVKFFWTGQMTHCIGQNGNFSFESKIKQFVEWLQDMWINNGSTIYEHGNELVTIRELDDGQKIFDYVRYINRWGKYEITDEPSLRFQLNPEVIDDLIDNEGYLIQYTHLGANYGYPYLSVHTMEMLQHAKQKFDSGELLVSTTSKLLNYNVHRKYLNWDYEINGNTLTINIMDINNEVEGQFIPTMKDLEGLTFYVPENLEYNIFINDQPIDFIKNNMDHEERYSISIPWDYLSYDEKE